MIGLMAVSAAIAAEPTALPGRLPTQSRHGLKDAVDLLANLTEAFTVALYLREPGGQQLHATAWHSMSRSFRSEEPVQVGEGLVGWVAKHNRPVDVDRYKQSSEATGLYHADEGIQAFVGMPVGELGVLVVDTKARQIFGEREKKIIRDFAVFMGQMVLQQETCVREALYGRILDLLYDIENAALSFSGRRELYDEILDAGRRFTGLSMGFLCLLHQGANNFGGGGAGAQRGHPQGPFLSGDPGPGGMGAARSPPPDSPPHAARAGQVLPHLPGRAPQRLQCLRGGAAFGLAAAGGSMGLCRSNRTLHRRGRGAGPATGRSPRGRYPDPLSPGLVLG